MLRKFGIVLFILTLVVAFSACGSKEEAGSEGAKAPAKKSTPKVVPGEMVLIPEGEFILGTDDKEHPTAYYSGRTMTLPAFWIDKYEVTNMEFMDFSIKVHETLIGKQIIRNLIYILQKSSEGKS